jgi:nucleoside 2-deoxyribosyltransferase
MNTIVRAIETSYRGYRFRSRLEARWAVFFDAAGIDWQYEVEGYVVKGERYLPDFWLPGLQTFVEIKPTAEEVERATSRMQGLVDGTRHFGIILAGAPSIDERPKVTVFTPYLIIDGRNRIISSFESWWTQCPFCDAVSVADMCKLTDDAEDVVCECMSGIQVIEQRERKPWSPRVEYAMAAGQRARFEHGENKKPKPYSADTSNKMVNVYVAGPVLEEVEIPSDEEDGEDGISYSCHALPWRGEIFGDDDYQHHKGSTHDLQVGRFRYTAPTISTSHSEANEGLPSECLEEVAQSDLIFVWIDREGTTGTLVEIGAARAWGKPIFVAFASEALSHHYYFAKWLADVAIVAPDAVTAWTFFTRWQDRVSQSEAPAGVVVNGVFPR